MQNDLLPFYISAQAYLMVLSDILQLAQSPEYSSHPKQQPEELVGFTVPQWMIEKMRAYIETAKTNPDTTDEELLRIAEEYAEMEEDSKLKKVKFVKFKIRKCLYNHMFPFAAKYCKKLRL